MLSSQEIEVRFLEIDEKNLINKLQQLGAKDLGEELLHEIIFYDKAGEFINNQKMVRMRKTKKAIFLSYKHHHTASATGTIEVELTVNDWFKTKEFLEQIGLVAYREQEKKRHSFQLDKVMVDIDTWPSIPTYVELEGESEEDLKKVAIRLGIEWKNVCFKSARAVIEEIYHIPVSRLKYFTFSKIG